MSVVVGIWVLSGVESLRGAIVADGLAIGCVCGEVEGSANLRLGVAVSFGLLVELSDINAEFVDVAA